MCRDHADVAAGAAVTGREVLPDNVKAIHYDLTLEPDFKKFIFDGTVHIE